MNSARRLFRRLHPVLADDYDMSRLAMSVYHMLRELNSLKSAGPSAADFAVQARHLQNWKEHWPNRWSRSLHAEVSSKAWRRPSRNRSGTGRVFETAYLGAVACFGLVKSAADLKKEISRFKREEIQQLFRAAAKILPAIEAVVSDFRQNVSRS